MLKVVVETTKEKDAYKAGKELTNKILQNLNDKPDFILLYCIGRYENYGGIQNLLKGLWENLPQDTKLIGGLVNGFITRQGCYAEGAVALAVKYDDMHIAVSYGKNTKRNPKKAAKQFVKNIKVNAKNTYKHKLLLTNISGMEIPKSSGDNPIIKSKIGGKIIPIMLKIMQKTKQKGFGREDELLKEISKQLPDYEIIHGSNGSVVDFSKNHQFLNKQVLTESVVGLLIETDADYFLNYANAAEETDIKLKITKISKDRRIIKKINNKHALSEFLRLMNWTMQDFERVKWVDITSKYPLGYYKNNKIFLRTILMIMGNYLGCLCEVEENEVFIAKMSTDKMVDSVNELLKPEKPDFGFFTSCIARQGYLGPKIFQVQEKLKKYFQEKPFLLIYVGGEGLKKQGEEISILNETITCAIFEKNQ
jgi:hypothetical protein